MTHGDKLYKGRCDCPLTDRRKRDLGGQFKMIKLKSGKYIPVFWPPKARIPKLWGKVVDGVKGHHVPSGHGAGARSGRK